VNRPPSNRSPRRGGSKRRPYPSNARELDPYGQRNSRLPASSEQNISFNTGTIAVLAGV